MNFVATTTSPQSFYCSEITIVYNVVNGINSSSRSGPNVAWSISSPSFDSLATGVTCTEFQSYSGDSNHILNSIITTSTVNNFEYLFLGSGIIIFSLLVIIFLQIFNFRNPWAQN